MYGLGSDKPLMGSGQDFLVIDTLTVNNRKCLEYLDMVFKNETVRVKGWDGVWTQPKISIQTRYHFFPPPCTLHAYVIARNSLIANHHFLMKVD